MNAYHVHGLKWFCEQKSGVSLTTISKAYNGKPISDKSAKKIADALVINLDLLIKKGV